MPRISRDRSDYIRAADLADHLYAELKLETNAAEDLNLTACVYLLARVVVDEAKRTPLPSLAIPLYLREAVQGLQIMVHTYREGEEDGLKSWKEIEKALNGDPNAGKD